jgi:hypothetical protein
MSRAPDRPQSGSHRNSNWFEIEGACDMDTRGIVYLVSARRSDNGWIHFRTCDRLEARTMAGRLGVAVTHENVA